MPAPEPHLHGVSTARCRRRTAPYYFIRYSSWCLSSPFAFIPQSTWQQASMSGGSPAAQAGSHEGCCLATSLPHSYSLSSGFCGIKAHLCRAWRMDCPWSETGAVFARQSAVLGPARCGSKSVSLRFIFRHIQDSGGISEFVVKTKTQSPGVYHGTGWRR